MWRCMQIERVVASSIYIPVIDKHDLSVSIWMRKWKDIQFMHLQ